MNKLLNLVSDKLTKITETDKIIAMDYIAFYGIDESEIAEYADSFIAECYHLEDGVYQPNDADEIPMAIVKQDGGFTSYSYNGQTILK